MPNILSFNSSLVLLKGDGPIILVGGRQSADFMVGIQKGKFMSEPNPSRHQQTRKLVQPVNELYPGNQLQCTTLPPPANHARRGNKTNPVKTVKPRTQEERTRDFCVANDIPQAYASIAEEEYLNGDEADSNVFSSCSEASHLNGESRARDQQKILGNTWLLGRYYRDLFGAENWGAAEAAQPYASGPVPKSAGGLAARRLRDPEARFWFSVMMAEAMLLPLCVAHDANKRDQLNLEIAGVLRLDTATAQGWVDGYVICWRQGRFPKMPTAIRVRPAPGRRTRAQVLGSLEQEIRRFVDA